MEEQQKTLTEFAEESVETKRLLRIKGNFADVRMREVLQETPYDII